VGLDHDLTKYEWFDTLAEFVGTDLWRAGHAGRRGRATTLLLRVVHDMTKHGVYTKAMQSRVSAVARNL
jgi:hypothetical protein